MLISISPSCSLSAFIYTSLTTEVNCLSSQNRLHSQSLSVCMCVCVSRYSESSSFWAARFDNFVFWDKLVYPLACKWNRQSVCTVVVHNSGAEDAAGWLGFGTSTKQIFIYNFQLKKVPLMKDGAILLAKGLVCVGMNVQFQF